MHGPRLLLSASPQRAPRLDGPDDGASSGAGLASGCCACDTSLTSAAPPDGLGLGPPPHAAADDEGPEELRLRRGPEGEVAPEAEAREPEAGGT
jgi:hypothetical protein